MFYFGRSKYFLFKVFFLFIFFTLVSCSGGGNEKDKITIKVNTQGTGVGHIRSLPVGIDCDKHCKAKFAYDSGGITLTAEPAAGSIFVAWKGACNGTDICNLSSSKNHSVIAVFDIIPIPMVSINVTRSGGGAGTVVSLPAGIDCGSVCKAQFKQNSGSVLLKPIANSSSVFTRWQGDCQGKTQCLLETNIAHTVNAVFDVKPTLYVDGISLINTDTNLAIAEYDPLYSGTILDLASVPTRNLNLRVNTTENVESVKITVNNTDPIVENTVPYSLNDLNGNYQNWTLTPGEQVIVVTPYSLDNTQGDVGETQTIRFTLSESKWTFSGNKLGFISRPGSTAPAAKSITLTNTGSRELNYRVTGIPNWLTVSPDRASVLEAASSNLQFQPDACSVDGRDEATVTVTTATLTQALSITRVCSTSGVADFALERFYISQSVPAMDSKQASADQASLVKGRSGLGRAFVTASEQTSAVPEVVLNYRLLDGTTGSINLTAPATVPLITKESQLSTTFNTELMKTFFSVGMEFYIDVDPRNLFHELDESNNRLPVTGYYKPTIEALKTFNITIVPITYKGEPAGDMSVRRIRKLLEDSWKMHPLNEIDIVVHAPITSSEPSWGKILTAVDRLRSAEGSQRAYYGIFKRGPGGGYAGLGYVGHLAAISLPSGGTIAHELGHNFGLPHAPCGGPSGPDPHFPYKNARTGVWGYDILSKRLKAPTLADLMSYCGPAWISDYNYKKVVNFHRRLSKLQTNNLAHPLDTQPVLMVNGSVKSELFSIDSVFSLDTRVLETEEGSYLLRGLDQSGTELFSQSFKTFALSHEATRHFTINVATDTASLSALHSLEISHQEDLLLKHFARGSKHAKNMKEKPAQAMLVDSKTDIVQITWDNSRYQSVMVRDIDTKQVLGLDKSGRLTIYSKNNQVEIIYSNGLNSYSEMLSVQSM